MMPLKNYETSCGECYAANALIYFLEPMSQRILRKR